jgi:hypothetical protein
MVAGVGGVIYSRRDEGHRRNQDVRSILSVQSFRASDCSADGALPRSFPDSIFGHGCSIRRTPAHLNTNFYRFRDRPRRRKPRPFPLICSAGPKMAGSGRKANGKRRTCPMIPPIRPGGKGQRQEPWSPQKSPHPATGRGNAMCLILLDLLGMAGFWFFRPLRNHSATWPHRDFDRQVRGLSKAKQLRKRKPVWRSCRMFAFRLRSLFDCRSRSYPSLTECGWRRSQHQSSQTRASKPRRTLPSSRRVLLRP